MFKFKGIKNTDMGVYVKEENFLGKAPINYEEIQIDGRDGEILIPLNYQNFHSSLSDVVITKNNFDEVMDWLNGTGELEYNGKKTTATFYEPYVVMKHQLAFSISFIREPFWYPIEDEYELVTTVVTNEGNVNSKPLIKLTKTNYSFVELRINGIKLKYTFKDESVVIDCEELEARFGTTLRNNELEIGFEFPTLDPGVNKVDILSGGAKIEMKRKDCYL